MYRIGEVCEKTSLTEKTVRFYITQHLIVPEVEAGLHYRSYRFSDADISRLQDIAALRRAEFSIAEIQQMLEQPERIPQLLAEKRHELMEKKSAIQSVLNSLDGLGVREQTDFSELADSIEPRSALRRETPVSTRNRLLWLACYTGVFLIMGFVVTGGKRPWLICVLLFLLAGIEFLLKAITYFRYNYMWRKLSEHTEGRVISVIPDDDIVDFWPETEWDTLHGLTHLGFFHWHWIQPDHWVPLIQFETAGETVTAAYRYGAFRNSWVPGEILRIACEPGKPQQLFPVEDKVLQWKAWIYLIMGISAIFLFVLAVHGILTGWLLA